MEPKDDKHPPPSAPSEERTRLSEAPAFSQGGQQDQPASSTPRTSAYDDSDVKTHLSESPSAQASVQALPPKSSTSNRATLPEADGDDYLVGASLGGYSIQREVGRGGMGVVYEARDEALNRPTALKVISQELCAQRDFVARFKREARVAAQVSHQNLVTVYAAGESDGRHYMAMEFVEGGRDLKELMTVQGQVALEDALEYARQAAEGLAAIHEAGIIHRDIKPANLLLDGKERVRVTDYGLAKPMMKGVDDLTAAPMIMGTFPYIPPEQCETGQAGPEGDVYALGITLYEMLAGKKPYKARGARDLLKQVREKGPRPLEEVREAIPHEVIEVVKKMMAPDVDQRFQSARDAAHALEYCLRLVRGETDARDETLQQVLAGAGARAKPMPMWLVALLNLGVLLTAMAVLWAVGRSGAIGGMGAVWHTLNNAKYAALPQRDPHPAISLIDLQDWPVPVKRIEELIDEIDKQEPAVIALDLLFTPSDDMRIANPEDLAPAIEHAGNVVLLTEWESRNVTLPLEPLRDQAFAMGFTNLPQAILDKRIHRASLRRITADAEPAKSFALAAAESYRRVLESQGTSVDSALLTDVLEGQVSGIVIDYSAADRFFSTQQSMSEEEIANLGTGFNRFKDTIVIVGSSKVVEDWHYAPLWGDATQWDGKRAHIPGLVLQGVIVDNLLTSKYLSTSPWWMSAILMLILGAVAFCAGALAGPRFLAPVWVIIVVVYLFMGMLALWGAGVVLPTAGPLLVIVFAAMLGVFRRNWIWKRS